MYHECCKMLHFEFRDKSAYNTDSLKIFHIMILYFTAKWDISIENNLFLMLISGGRNCTFVHDGKFGDSAVRIQENS